MGYKGNFVQGEIPESGAIFMSNVRTHKECLKRKLFGLPSGMSNFVLHVKEGMPLFLFEFERRLLYGVFRATCDGEINIEPKAFRPSGQHFPAQVRFTTVYDCSPLAEHEFKDVIRDNYFSGKKFHFGLNEKQVSKLMKLFRSKVISYPERNISRYDDKPFEGNARAGDPRKDIRHRIRFDSCDFRGDEVREVDDNMYINKHIIESRHADKREEFLTHYTTESDELGDCGRHDILGKHLDLREKDIEDDYRSVFNKPCGHHLDEIGLGSSEFLMDGANKDIIDYNRLKDEYNVREGIRRSLKEHTLTNHVFSHFNHDDYSSCDPSRIDVPDIQLSPSCFDDGSSFIPIANNCTFYPSPKKVPMTYYSRDEGSNQYLDAPNVQSSIFPKFISSNLSSSDAGLRAHEVYPTDNNERFCEKPENNHSFGTNHKRVGVFSKSLRVHEVDPTDNDERFCEKPVSKHSFGTTRKRGSVFSRLSSTLRHEEQAFETGEKHELNSSVDQVMKMLEKVVSSPKKRSGKSIPIVKQDGVSNSPDGKIEDYKFPDVNLEVDADMEHEEAEGESVFKETRLVDFKRRNKSNKRIGSSSKENTECLVGATSYVAPVVNDQLTAVPCKRRKLVRPAFVEKNIISDSVGAYENTLPENERADVIMVPACHEIIHVDSTRKSGTDSADVVLESPKKVEAFMKSMVPTCHENVHDSNSTKAETLSMDVVLESPKEVEAFIQSMVPTCHENTHDDSNSTKAGTDSVGVVLESPKEVEAFIQSMVPTCHENTHDESNLTKAGNESVDVVLESPKKVDAFIQSMVPTCHENTHDDSNSTKARTDSVDVLLESSEKVDAFIQSIVPTCHESTHDDGNSIKAGTESSKKVDISIKPIDLNMLPTSDESSSSKDDNSTKVAVESEKSGNEDGNAESRLVSDVFVERIASKDDQKMCGWIEW